MLPTVLFQLITIFADIVLFIFVGFYLLKLHSKEQKLEKKEDKADADYHHVVDEALSKERQILADAQNEATHIISGAKSASEEAKKTVDSALSQMVVTIQNEAHATSGTISQAYQAYLKQIAGKSLTDFQAVTTNLEKDLQAQVSEFHKTFLKALEKELEAYKQTRMQQTEAVIARVIQKASQEILNKSISLEDHQQLVIDSLEKAKKEGVFN